MFSSSGSIVPLRRVPEMTGKREIHEPEAELVSAEESMQDTLRLQEARVTMRHSLQAVSIRVPMWALLEALDSLEPPESQQIARRVQERLAEASGS
jgi:hypothetical protein